MATVKKMARIVIMDRLKVTPAISVFDEVGALADADLTIEFNKIKSARLGNIQTSIDRQTAELAVQQTKLTQTQTELS